MWKHISYLLILSLVILFSISINADNNIEEKIRSIEEKIENLEKRLEKIEESQNIKSKPVYEPKPPVESTNTKSYLKEKKFAEIPFNFAEKISKTGYNNIGDKIIADKVIFSADAFRIDKVVKKDMLGRRSFTDEKYSQVFISITNDARDKFLDYSSPSGIFTKIRLEDNFGNEYIPVNFGFNSVIEGKIEGIVSVSPGAKISDILVFEAPRENASALLLTFPAEQFKGKDKIRVLIPLKTGYR
ncbi:MAG: hypothetical protein HY934_08860 [Candidatus Firestonebacteria bacterium]|nr:hypothetical protein [Candidatus Firestonebacteria bacterium]